MSTRELLPFFLVAVAWIIMAGALLLGAQPLLPAAARPWIWGTLTLTGTPLAAWALELMTRHVRRRGRVKWMTHRLQSLQHEAARRVATRLTIINEAFSPAFLRLEADTLRAQFKAKAVSAEQRNGRMRLLLIEGPGSNAWWGLARAAACAGDHSLALRAAAEARRIGEVTADEWLTLAEDLLGAETDPWASARAGRQVGLTVLALTAESHSAAQSAELYALLTAAQLPFVTQLMLWREVLAATRDSEEASRQAARLGSTPPADAELRELLRAGWAAPLAAPELFDKDSGEFVDDGQSWVDTVPPLWRGALNLEPWVYVDPPTRYRSSLPVYAVAQGRDARAVADDMLSITAEPVTGRIGADQSPALLTAQVRAALWPRTRRSRTALTEVLAALAPLKLTSHVVAGLTTVAAALNEETDPRLGDLRIELERQVRCLSEPAALATMLNAAGLAWAPVAPTHALELWHAALTSLAQLDAASAKRLGASFVGPWLAESRRPDLGVNGLSMLRLAMETALSSRNPAALEEALLALLAQPSDSPLRTEFQGLLAKQASTHAARLALAWQNREMPALVRAALGLVTRAPEQWSWTVLAIASRAEPGDEVVLRPLLDVMRTAAASHQPGPLGAWLALAYTVEQLEERNSLTESRRALQALLTLPSQAVSAALPGLRLTVSKPTSRWLATVEEGLTYRLMAIPRTRDRAVEADLLRRVEAIAAILPPARLDALINRWMVRWQGDVVAAAQRVWPAAIGTAD